MIRKSLLLFLSISIFLFFFNIFSFNKTQAQTCAHTPTSTNSVTSIVAFTVAGDYKVWSRILAPDSASNSFYLQIDNNCAINIGDQTTIPANSFTWVDYQDGVVTNSVSVNLTAGDHTVKITEREGGVGIDKLLFITDMQCVPTGTGDNCPSVTDTPSPTLSNIPPTIPPSNIITIGETNILSRNDSGNGNQLFATKTTLSQTATLQSLSFYVTTATGNLRLGIFDATGPGGAPGARKAETASLTPTTGWNTAGVTPVSLPAGNYWLAYLPSNNTLGYRAESTGGDSKQMSHAYGPMPTTYSTAPGSTHWRWSLYATLNTSASEPTPTKTPAPTSTPLPTATPSPLPTPTPTSTPTPIPLPTATPTKTPTPTPTGNGLQAVYYNNTNFTGISIVRIDPSINFNWGTGSPHSSIAGDTFSTIWTGFVVPRNSQTYTFYAKTDDGVRLWVNGQQLINSWINQSATERSGSITLIAGRKYTIRMEYYENNGSALAQLRWSSSAQIKEIIPQSRLYSF